MPTNCFFFISQVEKLSIELSVYPPLLVTYQIAVVKGKRAIKFYEKWKRTCSRRRALFFFAKFSADESSSKPFLCSAELFEALPSLRPRSKELATSSIILRHKSLENERL